ncbi:MAG TPA: hypothetical protein VGQ92_24460 [Actinoplanes sp.]|nr:hypothetical protein [Actinoplanes sp.]
MDHEALAAVPLGEITCPSGELVVVDTGYLGMWSGERPPSALDPEMLPFDDPDMAASVVARSVDFEVVGRDAAAAARSFDRQAGESLYDIPGHGVEQIQ